MTIIDVELSWSRVGGSFESQDGRTFKGSVTQGWQVTHSADATVQEILFASGVPQVGDTFGNSFLVCKRQGFANQISPIYTIVTVDFDGQIGSDGNGKPDPEQTPINNPPVIDWSDETSNEPIDQDVDGNPITTVNGEPIEGVTMDVADPVLVVTKNFASYNPHLIHAYRQAVNSDTFAGFPPGTARLIASSAKFVSTGQNQYWSVTGRFKFRYPYNTTPEKAWYARVRHEGFRVRTDLLDESKISHALDTSDPPQKVVTPVLLTASGFQETEPTAAHWLEFKRYNELPFNALGFL
jgi:hypothetical protein